MPRPDAEIAGCLAAHARLQADIADLTVAHVRAASRLPGWSVGHVLSHLARNADSVTRRLVGAAKGEIVEQYVGGFEGRAAEIEEGSGRPARALIADVLATNADVEAAIEAMPDDAWDNTTLTVRGDEIPASTLAFTRWREVDTHHADLGLGFEPADWPPELVDRWLPSLLDGLRERSDPTELAAWILGRGPAPTLRPWT